MPLLDHFHPPLAPTRSWESFHAFWIATIGETLNLKLLPPRYYAETQSHIGGRVEVDVATLERSPREAAVGNGPVATLTAEAWAPPAPPLVIPGVFPDEFEVLVFGGSTGAHFVAAIELVSPGTNDRPESRRAFAIKCASYIQAGVGPIVVDVVTERLANLHDEMIGLLDLPDRFRFPGETQLYAVAYRPARREPGGDQVDVWPAPLAVGQPLTTLPLALRGGPIIPVDLEATYAEARVRSRL